MDRLASLLDDLRESSLELAWSQWTAAGVAGVHESTATVVDPEALLLASLALGRCDARLFDEVLDWLVANSQLLDLARLRRLRGRTGASARPLLAAAARLVSNQGVGSNFGRLLGDRDAEADSPLADEAPMVEAAEAEPLFYSARGQDVDWGESDPVFAAAGFLRAPVRFRRLSGRPNPGNPACLRFRVRALVGLGSRAEVLVYLLTHEWSHGRLIAERTAYGQAPIAAYLASLFDMGLVEQREAGKKLLYRLSDDVRQVFPVRPSFVDWVRVWPGLVALLEALPPAGVPDRPTGEEAGWIRLAGALAASEAAFRTDGFEVEVGDLRGWALRGPQVLRDAVERVTTRVGELAA